MPKLIALGAFVGVVLAGAGLILIQFSVPEPLTKVAPWVVVVAIVVYLQLSVPSSRLEPARRQRRDQRRVGAVVGVLSGCAVLAAITAATYLTSWSEWLVLGFLVTLVIGIFPMLHVRFTIGA